MRPAWKAVAAFVFATAAPAFAGEATPPATPVPLLHRVGFPSTRAAAEHAIGFAPFVPSARITDTALLPPFHEDHESSHNDGIGYAYESARHTFTLRQWPRAGGSLAAFPALRLDRGCADTHAIGGTQHPSGVAWATPRRVYALQMEGEPNDARSARILRTEWRRLVRRGACR